MTAGSSNSHRNIAVENIEQSDHQAIADAICCYFASVGGDLQPLNPSSLPAYLSSLPICEVQPWEVCQELGRIESRKASGPGNISARLFCQFSYELAKPLTDIIDASYKKQTVPAQWKRACVIPIPKSSPATIDNLRPGALAAHF